MIGKPGKYLSWSSFFFFFSFFGVGFWRRGRHLTEVASHSKSINIFFIFFFFFFFFFMGSLLVGCCWVVICYCWIFYHCIEISEIPSNSIIIYTIQSCSLEISISALRILFIDDLQFICDEFEVCEAETVSLRLRSESLRLRLFVAASYDSNPSHIDLSVGANTNLCRKRKADITDMRQYIVRICGEGHVACNLLRLQWLSKNFDKSRRILT